ncbi:MAG: Asp-tRNA(Asn)/Glu-tRNA(Gln) amidotransferase subunit GatC [Erysipelotrichaceae bacterium]
MNKTDYQALARQLMFALSDDELIDIEKDFDSLNKQLAMLEKINTSGVRKMVFPFEDETTYLREDEISDCHLSKEDIFLNAPKHDDEYLIVPKVVK